MDFIGYKRIADVIIEKNLVNSLITAQDLW